MNTGVVRASLAVALGGAGWPPYPVLPASPDLPCAVVNDPDEILYHQSYAGEATLTIAVTLLVARADEESAQNTLDTATSFEPDSLIFALEAAAHVNWTSLIVRSAGPYIAFVVGDTTQALGVDLVLELTA